jgi:RimJ/RimL family protein N-acetyltransferase
MTSDTAQAPVIETERLVLRRLGPDDAAFILGLLNEPSFLRFIGDKGVRTLDDARAYIDRGPVASYARHFGLYLTSLRDGGEPIGICGLVKRDGLEDADVGFAFLPRHWSRGYASEAARAVLDHAKRELGIARVAGITDPENTGSLRVLEKLGLAFVGMVRLSEGASEVRLFSREL